MPRAQRTDITPGPACRATPLVARQSYPPRRPGPINGHSQRLECERNALATADAQGNDTALQPVAT
jgi:hypothetical protein